MITEYPVGKKIKWYGTRYKGQICEGEIYGELPDHLIVKVPRPYHQRSYNKHGFGQTMTRKIRKDKVISDEV